MAWLRAAGERSSPNVNSRDKSDDEREPIQARVVLDQCRRRHCIHQGRNRWRAEWSEIETLARTADAAGLEFILPIARWKGYGGETSVRGASFETLTHAAALAAITRHIAIFSTVHVPLVHPVFAAKALMTIDHVSRGRAGLNIVCGWNQEEFDMFGHRQSAHNDRYKQGFEWFSVLQRIFEADAPFDHDGGFYELKQVIGAPARCNILAR